MDDDNDDIKFKSAIVGLTVCIVGLAMMFIAVFNTRDWMLFAFGAAILWFGISS